MIISYQGLESFKIQFGDIIIAYNPISKDSKFKSVKYGADIALVSTNHPDFNGTDTASRGDRMPFAISGPGEYEIKEVFIKGFLSSSEYGGKPKVNTIYKVTLEGINLCLLGALSTNEISNETREELDEIDIDSESERERYISENSGRDQQRLVELADLGQIKSSKQH